MLRLLRQISLRQLRASWGRTTLVIAGIATGVSLMVAINIINTSVLANFKQTIELIAGPAELEITMGVGELGFPESTVDIVRADGDVEAAIPLIRGTVAFADDANEAIELFGVDLTNEEDLDRYRIGLVTDRGEILGWLNDPHSLALTTAFAAQRGLQIGQTISLSTPHGIEKFTVRGLLDTEGIARAFGGRLAIMDLPAAQLLLGRSDQIDQIELIPRAGADVDKLRERMERRLMERHLPVNIARPVARSAQYEAVLSAFQAMLTGLSLLCLVAGIYIIYNTTSTAAVHRALAMANLRLIGAESTTLFSLLLREAAALGIIGTAIGIPSGLLLARILIGLVSESMGVIYQLRFPTDAISFSLTHLIVIGVAGVSAAIVASYFPARRVAALEPLEVIRAELRSLGPATSAGRLLLWWILLVLISAIALILQVRFKSVAWGNFGSTLWFASSIVVAIPLVSGSARLLSRLLSRAGGAEGRVAAESLFRSPTRTGVTVAAITLVLTVAVTFASLTVSFRYSVGSYYREGGVLLGDLIVSAVTTEGGWLETPLPDSIEGELAEIPGVKSVELARAMPGQIYRDQRIMLLGLSDGLLDASRYGPRWYLAGDHETAAAALRSSTGVNIAGALADRFDLRVGDHVNLASPGGLVTLPVVGVVRDYMSDRGTVIMNRKLLVDRWGDRSANRFNVYLATGTSADAVRGEILKRLGSRYRVKILSPPEILAYHVDAIDRAFAFTDAIQLLIIIVTVAGIFDLLLAAIVERRRELALWRVIGADESMVRRSVVYESATIGVLGAALGAVVGLITAWTWIGINFRYLLGYYLEYRFAFQHTAWYVALVLTMTVLAGYGAARRATQQPVLEGIQAE